MTTLSRQDYKTITKTENITNLQVQMNVKQLKRDRGNPDEIAKVRSEAPTVTTHQEKSKKANDSCFPMQTKAVKSVIF